MREHDKPAGFIVQFENSAMRNGALFFACGILVLVYVVGAQAAHPTWDNRVNGAERTRMCRGHTGARSWVQREAYERCETCQARCYRAVFNATAETSGSPLDLCDTAGDECTLTLYIKTASCCCCQQGHTESENIEQDCDENYEEINTESYCEVPSFTVLVNGYWTLPLDSACNVTSHALFTQDAVKNDCTLNQLRDCDPPSYSGARLTQAYNDGYRNGRYPDPCFADNHWISSFSSENKGLIASQFEMWRPNSNSLWFDVALEKAQAPQLISCHDVPKASHIVVYNPPDP